ncbi:hypothetical protein Tco_0187654, partial [Tanacetum coccineum]
MGVDLNEISDHHVDDDDVILANTTTCAGASNDTSSRMEEILVDSKQQEVVVKKKRVEFSQAFSAAYDVLEKKVWDFLAGNISPSEVASIFNCVVI